MTTKMSTRQTTQQAPAANVKPDQKTPCVFGSHPGERISFSVYHGKLWAHVYVPNPAYGKVADAKRSVRVASMALNVDETSILETIARTGRALAMEQNEAWEQAQKDERAGFEGA